MAKNKLSDLNNALFEQLERLNDADLTGDALREEAERAKAITKVSHQIISNAALYVRVRELVHEDRIENGDMTGMLEHEKW